MFYVESRHRVHKSGNNNQIRRENADLVGEGRLGVGSGEGAVYGAALVEDVASHGDGAQREPEEALLRADPDKIHKKPSRIKQAANQSNGTDAE